MANESLKKGLLDRANKVRSSKVKRYVKQGLLRKIDQAGDFAGIWIEKLEADFDKLKPEGLMAGFEGSVISTP